jgi:hypothetical protein
MRLRQLAPAALVLAGGVATARAISGSPTSLRILAVVYTCGATTASLALASQRRWRYFPVLPIAFACLHLSYGLGFIAGLSDLAGRMLSRTARPGVHQRTEIAE